MTKYFSYGVYDLAVSIGIQNYLAIGAQNCPV